MGAPLYPLKAKDRPIHRLNPLVQIDGKPHYLAMHEMTALRTMTLGSAVASLEEQRSEIIAAIDFLTTGI